MAARRRLHTLGACMIAALVCSCDDEPTAPADTSPPAAVTDLLAGTPTATSIELTWTAPGDDGTSGRASQYDVRQLNAPITEENWSSALPVQAEVPSPKAAGEIETLVVENLAPGQAYSFALRTSDEAANSSTLSNVTTLSTFDLTSRDESELVELLEIAYARLDYPLYTTLFPAPDDASFLFILNDPWPGSPVNWDRTEELRIHRRMFEPENVPPGEQPVDPQLWLSAVFITLSPNGAWTERPDLYQSPSNPDGLDPARWRVTAAEYHATILWDMPSDLDYRVDGDQYFVVIDDLAKSTGESGKFALYRWEDLGSVGRVAVEDASWSDIKDLFR